MAAIVKQNYRFETLVSHVLLNPKDKAGTFSSFFEVNAAFDHCK